MRTVLAVFDDFFDEPEKAQKEILDGVFEPIANPVDKVLYPGINSDLPNWVCLFVLRRLNEICGSQVIPLVIFARLTSSETGPAPHRIHSDKIMSQFSAHVYLSSEWPAGSGTAFWSHKTEGPMHDKGTDEVVIARDSYDVNQWIRTLHCQGKFNRLLIHDSRFWHSAEPVGGWGGSPHTGRVVLTCFFNTKGVQ